MSAVDDVVEILPDHFIVVDTKYDQFFGIFAGEWAARGWAEDRWGHEATFHDDTIRFVPLRSRRGTLDWGRYGQPGHDRRSDYEPTARELAEPVVPER